MSIAPDKRAAGAPVPRRLRQGFVWSAVSALFIQGSTFIVSVVVANLLGRGPFGEFAILLSTLLALASVAQVAAGVITIRYVAEYREHAKPRAGNVIGLCSVMTWTAGTLCSLGLIVLAAPLAEGLLGSQELATPLTLGAAVVLLGAVNGFQSGTLAGLESYRTLAYTNSVVGSLHVLIIAVATWLGNLDGALAGMSLSAVLRWGAFAYALRRELALHGIVVSRRGLLDERTLLWRFALPAAVSGLTPVPALWLANAFLAMQPNGYPELALFTAANNIRLVVVFFPQILNTVTLSVLNYQFGANDEGGYRRIFWTNVAGTAAFACLGAAVAVAFGGPALRLYGPSFVDGYPVLLVLLLSTIFEATALACYQLIQSRERMWASLLLVNLPRDAAIVGLAWVLAPEWGAMGLAIAYSTAWTIAFLIIGGIGLRLGIGGFRARGGTT